MGYEGRTAYGEYKALVEQMKSLGADPDHGCGRAMWENNGDNGQYGTTMALMLLPYWSNGCIASMEGSVLRGQRHDAVPLRHGGRYQQQQLQPGARVALRQQRRLQGRAVSADARRQVPHGVHGEGQGPGREASGAHQARRSRSVEHLPGGRQRSRRAAYGPAGCRQSPRRRSARAKSRARHELVPAPERMGRDPRRQRSRRLAAHRCRGRSDAQRRSRPRGLWPQDRHRPTDRGDHAEEASSGTRSATFTSAIKTSVSPSIRSACRCW